ncbi:MAG: PepSY domain-containing protein [Burkholderiaceae bacterium]
MIKTRASLACCAFALSLTAMPALADDDCDVPVQRWQSREAARQMAAQRGWQVERLKIDDGCYEIRGRDADGREFKAKLDPETLAVVKIKHRERERDRAREKRPVGAAPSASQGAVAPVFKPGTAPSGRIE